MKKLVHHAIIQADAINALSDLEKTFAQLQSWGMFQSFSPDQKAEYFEALSELRELIYDLRRHVGEEQIAS